MRKKGSIANEGTEDDAKVPSETCQLCEKSITDVTKQLIRCNQKHCLMQFHKECVFLYMTAKLLYKVVDKQTGVASYEFTCEHCIMGTKKC